jgi:Fe(3+) dicitrate transport protein
MGIEPRLYYNYQIQNMASELQAGVRLNIENANEQRLNGKKADSKSGELVEDEMRRGKALSAFAHNSLSLSKKINLTTGVRLEHYDYEREIRRNSFMIGNSLLVRDTNLNAGNQVTSILPGVGLNINVSKNNTLFVGLHRGFAPPRVKDAISNQGQIYALDAEKSWNIELGTRGSISKYFEYEATLFSMNFSNQIIPESESSGGTGSGLVNGGRTLHRGVELAFLFDFGNLLKSHSKIHWKTNATYNKATFNKDRFIKDGTELVNISGNFTPYAPEYYVNSSFYFLHKLGFGAQISLNAVGAQYTDVLNSELPATNGRTGKLKAYTVADVNVLYHIPQTKVSLNVAVKNIRNERYIVSRRPQGIRVGNPRFISAGVDVSF